MLSQEIILNARKEGYVVATDEVGDVAFTYDGRIE